MSVIEVENLRVNVGDVSAVGGVSFEIHRGQRLGLIGESGCGKSLTALSIMGLLPDGIRAEGAVRYKGENLLELSEERICRIRGDRLGMVFQEPMTALNPVMRIGDQIAETLRIHRGTSRRAGRREALDLLERVQMPDPADKLQAYPHQLSGGQRQRVVIAIAIACQPSLLIADEPTTALDVTVQAQILALLRRLVDEEGTALLLITHDLPVVAGLCEDVMVMYGGRVVERGATREVFAAAQHPYTAGLLGAIPKIAKASRGEERRLATVPGNVPALGQFPTGCVYRDRCPRADDHCVEEPLLEGDRRQVACWHPVERSEARVEP